MPSGETHDRLTLYAIPLVILIAEQLGLTVSALLAVGMAFGSTHLSPDLDHDANVDPYKAWGPLKRFWDPYKYAVPHRSAISHTPIIGTLIRLIYLLFIPAVVVGVIVGVTEFTSVKILSAETVLFYLDAYKWQYGQVIFGIEIASLVHIGADWVT